METSQAGPRPGIAKSEAPPPCAADDIFVRIVSLGAGELGIDLPPGSLAAFTGHFRLLEARGQNMNLTAIKGAEDVARLHFLDSLALLNAVRFENARVIDVGSGAGFPGVPLKIAEPSINLTLVDSTDKRVAFLKELCAVQGIGADCVHMRAEDAGRDSKMRERYDIAVSRAVAELNVLCELCLPLVRTGGFFIAMKSVNSSDETRFAKSAISTLGAELQGYYDYTIPGTDIVHRAVIIKKAAHTPPCYPRRFAQIKKSPL